jgi:hypothetical protein
MRDATRHRRAITIATFALTTAVPIAARAQRASEPTEHASTRASAAAVGIDAPTAVSWRVRRAWTDAAEREYGNFVATIGQAVAAGRCHTLSRCLNNPAINPLHEAGSRPLRFRADCADTPYTLRAYFAYRKGLPFAYMRAVRGHGHDRRYLQDAQPDGVRLWTEFSTPRHLIESIGSEVHSGFFRLAPDVEDGDFYQTSVDRNGIRPGTMYYNPNGHVLVVYAIQPDGEILLFDGHPDNSLTHPHFTERLPLGSAAYGGGFKNFRPFVLENGSIVRTPNSQIPAFGGGAQFDHARYAVAGRSVTFHSWVRARVATDQALYALHTATTRARCEARCAPDAATRRSLPRPARRPVDLDRVRDIAAPSETVLATRSRT